MDIYRLEEISDNSSSDSWPRSLRLALRLDPDKSSMPLSLFRVLLDILCKESGFVEKDSGGGPVLKYVLPEQQQQQQQSVYCSVVAVATPVVTLIHGTFHSEDVIQTFTVNDLQPSNFIIVSGNGNGFKFKGMKSLSRRFKDKIARPLMAQIRSYLGLIDDGLSGLPAEVIVHLLSMLNHEALCGISRSCRRLNEFANQGFLWRRLFQKDFSTIAFDGLIQRENDGESINWKVAYKIEKLQQQQQALLDQNVYLPLVRIGPYHPVPRFDPPFPDFGGGGHWF